MTPSLDAQEGDSYWKDYGLQTLEQMDELDLRVENYEEDPNTNLSLQCSFCIQAYNDPVALKCSHVYCRSCFKTLVHSKYLECPLCEITFSAKYKPEKAQMESDLVEALINEVLQDLPNLDSGAKGMSCLLI